MIIIALAILYILLLLYSLCVAAARGDGRDV